MFNCYFVNSIKNITRVNRVDGGRYHFVPNTPIPRNWKKVIGSWKSKQNCLGFPQDSWSAYSTRRKTGFIVVHLSTVQTVNIEPCSHEEVDTRMMLHLKDAIIQDLSSILLKATNTDIVGICAFLLYKTSKHLCLLSIHKAHASLGPTHCRDFPFSFFQLFTGRDTTTAFIDFGRWVYGRCWEIFLINLPNFPWSFLSAHPLMN